MIATDGSRQQDLDLHLRFLRQEPAASAGGGCDGYLHALIAPHVGSLVFFLFFFLFILNIILNDCFSLCGYKDTVGRQRVGAL